MYRCKWWWPIEVKLLIFLSTGFWGFGVIIIFLFLNFCGSAIFNFKIQRLYLSSFSQNFFWIIILLLNIFIRIADLIFRLLIYDLTFDLPFRWPGSPFDPFLGIGFHFQFDGWISPKIIEILIDTFKWLFIKHK